MRHYAFNVGDYAAATVHLSDAEDLAYRRLLDAYYARELPLPADVDACCRLARASSAASRKAVETVLREFFVLEADGWHQARCDAEIARFSEKSEKARRSADARWTGSERNANAYANALPPQCEGNATHDPRPTTHKTPTPKDQGPVAAAPLPGWLPTDAWEAFLEARVAMKARPTERAKGLLLGELGKLVSQGQDPRAVLEQSVARGWRGLFPVKPPDVGKPGSKQQSRDSTASAIFGDGHGKSDERVIDGQAERVA